MATILTEHAMSKVNATVRGTDIWLSARDAEATTGWTLKPEGFCKGDICVPVPPARASEFAAKDEINIASLWRHMGLPLARTASGDTWVLGESSGARASQLQSLDAPDFSLPDLDGKMHALSAQRGKKVLLVSWASW